MKRTESKTNQTKILVNKSTEKPPALIVDVCSSVPLLVTTQVVMYLLCIFLYKVGNDTVGFNMRLFSTARMNQSKNSLTWYVCWLVPGGSRYKSWLGHQVHSLTHTPRPLPSATFRIHLILSNNSTIDNWIYWRKRGTFEVNKWIYWKNEQLLT
jgi:hypothetical protein